MGVRNCSERVKQYTHPGLKSFLLEALYANIGPVQGPCMLKKRQLTHLFAIDHRPLHVIHV